MAGCKKLLKKKVAQIRSFNQSKTRNWAYSRRNKNEKDNGNYFIITESPKYSNLVQMTEDHLTSSKESFWLFFDDKFEPKNG